MSPNSFMAQVYNVVKEADPYHAIIGAINCANTWLFSDVPSFIPGQADLSDATIPFGIQPHTQLSLDYLMIGEQFHNVFLVTLELCLFINKK